MKFAKVLFFYLILLAFNVSSIHAKYLPETISGKGIFISYRFVSIKTQTEKGIEISSFEYLPNDMGYIGITSNYASLEDVESNSPYSVDSLKVNILRKEAYSIEFKMESQDAIFTFTPSGKILQMKLQPEDYNASTSIDPPVIIGYIYDKNENITDMYLPNSALGDRVNRELQMISYIDLTYDNKKGIFRNVNPTCFLKLYNVFEIIPYYYFLGNNLIEMAYKKKEDRDKNEADIITKYNYKYNKKGYPIEMSNGDNVFYITYTKAY